MTDGPSPGTHESGATLEREDLDPDPVTQFQAWLEAAAAAGTREPHAMTLATADRDGVPSARVVLLRGVDRRGFTWYTHRESLKSRDLAANPRAALVFHWKLLERQVRVSGDVSVIPDEESTTYFASRPRKSQLSAWASPQSSILADRAALESATRRIDARYPSGCPAPTILGRLQAGTEDDRVLAGPARPHARPVPLPS